MIIDIDKLARESGASFERMSQQYSTVDWWQFCPNELQIYTEKVVQVAQAAERERAKSLVDELNNIINARPREWGEGLRDHFEQWVKNRARVAIAKYEGGNKSWMSWTFAACLAGRLQSMRWSITTRAPPALLTSSTAKKVLT